MASSSPTFAAMPLDVLDDPVEQQRFTRWVEDGGRQVAESSFQVSGMYCAACSGVIESALTGVDGVVSAQVGSASQRAKVRWDPKRTQVSALVKAVRSAGYDAVPDAAAPAREQRRVERRAALWRVFVASFCAMQVMMFATPSYVATGDELAPDLRQLLNWGSWVVSIPVLLFSAGPFLRNAWRSLRLRRISMDVPVALGILVTFIASTGATFDPDGAFGHEVYFDSFTMFVSFLLAGRFLEMTVRHRAAESLEAALSGMPETALRLEPNGEAMPVSVLRLRAGDRVRVPLGSAFPADGRLLIGPTQADESLLTGESSPVTRQAGDEVVGGSLNVGAPVDMQVERVGADTRFEAIVSMLRDALSQRPALARQADQWAGPFLWGILALAGLAAVAWSWYDPSRALWVAVSVLIVTCPCALSLAAPAALVAAARALARRGVVLQRLDALEALASMSRLFLDKTGTLTQDQPALVALHDASGAVLDLTASPVEVGDAALLAAWSAHPLSKVLAQRAPAAVEDRWQAVREQPGSGLEGRRADGSVWRLGSRAWVLGSSSDVAPATDQPVVQVWFGPVGQLRWCFEFAEQLRPDALSAVEALRAGGVGLGLLSGDASRRVAHIAEQVGIADVVAGAQPQDKLAHLSRAQARGERVGMVGDGVNDAPVLARADVSFAMGQGALVARVHADAVVVSGRLQDVVMARQLAQRTMQVVRQNLIWAATYNLACIPLALAGYLPPWAAGLGMALSSLLVVGNATRLAYARPGPV
jgi:Cu2+-exporting ATPase